MTAAAAERTLAPLGRRRAAVVAAERYGAYVVLSAADAGGPAPDPGQFYMLTAAERWGGGDDERPFLPRAFSVMRRHADGTLDFLLEAVGPGTERLAELAPGDDLWLLGPLGRGFAPPRDGRRPLLVGGGVGTAPLAIWSDALTQSASSAADGHDAGARTGTGDDPLVLLGFRDAAHAAGAALIDGARVATDDGSAGHRGVVTDLLRDALGRTVARTPIAEAAVQATGGRNTDWEVYACGPPPMLEAVRALCARDGVPAQLALESGMACGYGACFGCVVATRAGYVRLCVDGPVLDAADLDEVTHP
ncbi:MAG: dihydroorotate dehydrogenase electron transfer subunit [Solirubrobacteraceae bacterium]|nr:dihydroorotate dehydrogenase electron transfer subunit [Solirubrobacteraceae bacterium]